MSTLDEIEAAIDRLPPAQQEELHASLGARLEARPQKGVTPEEFERWIADARGAAIPGVTTDEIMEMTRGQE